MSRESTVAIPPARAELAGILAAACKPRALTTVSQHADAHRVLSAKGSGEPGRWQTRRTPYLQEIMDALSVTSPVSRIVLMFAAQLGKTEVGLNWIQYVVDHAPAPMLVVLPTLEARKRWVRQRLNPMFAESEVLQRALNTLSKRDASNTEDIKEFAGGMLILGGANSPASLASMPIRYVLADEIDRFPWEVGRKGAEEGDPLGLIDERTKTFPRRKVLLVSTPTTLDSSRVDGEYKASDQRQYHLPCPHCSEYQTLVWQHADGNYGLICNKTTGQVYYACVHCGAAIEEHHKPAMLAAGRWVAKYPERRVRGYHLNGLYSPLGLGFTWAEIWREWQVAQQDTSRLKRFINTTLGEIWEEKGATIDAMALITRLETPPTEPPWGKITAGVDVQKDRLEITFVGWGADEECWVLDHAILPGDTALPEVWADLHDALSSQNVALAGIDAGYNTTLVQKFCDARQWAMPLKGVTGLHRPLIEDERKRRQRLRYRRRKGTASEPVGVDQGKAILYARLRITQPGPGYVHFLQLPAFDDEYFAQLAAEKLITKARGGRPYQEWVQTRARNEALDCLNYALAAHRLLNAGGVQPRTVAAESEKLTTPQRSKKTNNRMASESWSSRL